MDLSKLPRLSKTEPGDAPQPVADVTPNASDPAKAPGSFCTHCGAPLRAGARFCDSCGAATAAGVVDYAPRSGAGGYAADPGVGAEVWVSAVIGIALMLMGRSFGGYLLATITNQPYHTNVTWMEGPNEGKEVAYWDLSGRQALSDSAIWLFGLAMVLEAAALGLINTRMRGKGGLLTVALAITVLATVYNIAVSVRLLADGTLPIMSLLAVAFGGYIALFEWRLLQTLRAARA